MKLTPAPFLQHPARLLPALLALAAVALRLPYLDWGLPDLTEEAFPLKKAFAMGGWADGQVQWDPETAGWPALSFYVHMVGQHLHYGVGWLIGLFADRYDFYLLKLDLTPVVILARALGAVAAGGIVWIGARLGRRLAGDFGGLLAGASLAFGPMLLRQSLLITPDILLAFFAALAVARSVAVAENGHRRDLLLAALWIGLGAACKYTTILLLPVLVAAWWLGLRRGGSSLRWLGLNSLDLWLAAGVCLGAFVLTNPFLLADLRIFTRDFAYQAVHLGEGGHLGQQDVPAWLFYLRDVLAPAMGWPGLLLAVGGLIWAAWRRRGPWLVLLLAVVLYYGGMGLLSTRFERYLLPALLPASLGLAAAWLALKDLCPRCRGRVAVAAGVLLALFSLLPPALGARTYLHGLSLPNTMTQAKNFMIKELGSPLYVAMESYTPDLPRAPEDLLRADPAFDGMSFRQQKIWLDRPFYNLVYLPFAVTRPELTEFYYDLRLLAGYDYVVTSGAVRGRFAAEPARFPRRATFYRDLDRFGRLVKSFAPGAGARGPEIRIYRLDPEGKQRLRMDRGLLKPDFYLPWLDRVHAPQFHGFLALLSRHALQREQWQRADLFYEVLLATQPLDQQLRFLPQLGQVKLRLHDFAAAEDIYGQLLALAPDDPTAEGYLGYALLQLGRQEEARRHLERCLQLSQGNPSAQAAADWARGQLRALDKMQP